MAQRILIIRLSAIGDAVFASPLIAALRRTYPEAYIAWLAEPAVGELLRPHPLLDEVIVWPKARWKRLWKERAFRPLAQEMRDFARMLRAQRFDLVLDVQGLLKSGVLAFLTAAPRRISLGGREGSRWLMTQTLPRAGQAEAMSSEYRFLAAQIGLDTQDFKPSLHTDAETRTAVDRLLAQEGIPPVYAVLAPFTTRPQKHWFEDAWRELIPRLADDLGLGVVMLGGPADREAARRIADGLPVHDLAGRTSLLEAAEIIRRAALVIGVDTGLTHMGTAFARPTLALFGSTRPYLTTPSPHTRVLYHALPCAPCGRHPSCQSRFDCMRAITAEQVLRQVREMMLEGSPA